LVPRALRGGLRMPRYDHAMTFGDRVLLYLHVVLVIFTVGPVTVAIMAAPRTIKSTDQKAIHTQFRITQIYGAGTLLAAIIGGVLAGVRHESSKPWVIISMTLYVVALVIIVLIMREQRRAIAGLDPEVKKPTSDATAARARIASMAGITGIIWLVILIFMVWKLESAPPGIQCPTPFYQY
jgi:CDP-diglyceride synthetase